MSANANFMSLFKGLSQDAKEAEEGPRAASLELPAKQPDGNSPLDVILEGGPMTVSGATADTMISNLNRRLGPERAIPTLPSIRHIVKWRSKDAFDVQQLPSDMYLLFGKLKERFGGTYALHIMFTMRTAIELHRAWHMTLLTSKVLQQLKDKDRIPR